MNSIDPSAGEGGIWDWLVLEHAAVPMLPAAAMRVIQLTSGPDSSLVSVTEAVSKDQVLASRVLAFANSAFSSPSRRIASLADAVVRMGVVCRSKPRCDGVVRIASERSRHVTGRAGAT